MTLTATASHLCPAPIRARLAKGQTLLLSLMLALVLSACSGTRELGPTAFIDADTTDYVKDERDFPELGKYDDAPPVNLDSSNVLDLVKSLPETIRSVRDRLSPEEPSEDTLIRADVPTEKPVTAEQEETDPSVPANDIAKSLIGDLSSNEYTDPVPSEGFKIGMEGDDFEPVPVKIVNLPDTLRFAPQLVVPKALAAPRAYTRTGLVLARNDLSALRQSVYLSKLNQSASTLLTANARQQFAQSSVNRTVMMAAKDPSTVRVIAQGRAQADDSDFVVLGRINADGLILSGTATRTTAVGESAPSGGQADKPAQVVMRDSPDPAARPGNHAAVALLTDVAAAATFAGFAAR